MARTCEVTLLVDVPDGVTEAQVAEWIAFEAGTRSMDGALSDRMGDLRDRVLRASVRMIPLAPAPAAGTRGES